MKPSEIKRLRERYQISRIELAAHTGLPSDFIRQIEDEEVVALSSDLERLERALKTVQQRKNFSADSDE